MTDLSFWLVDGVLPFYCYLMVVFIDYRKTFFDLAVGVFPFFFSPHFVGLREPNNTTY